MCKYVKIFQNAENILQWLKRFMGAYPKIYIFFLSSGFFFNLGFNKIRQI